MRNLGRFTALMALAVCLAAALGACRRAPAKVEGPQGTLAVAGFFQPHNQLDLLAGYLPENAADIDAKYITALDAAMEDVLSAHKTRVDLGPAVVRQCQEQLLASGEHARSLGHWIAVGRCAGVDWLLVPQITYLRQRDGSEMSVRDAASVTMDLFLVNVGEASLAGRFHFEETQLSLTENILDAGKFMRRGAKWITAQELAREGIDRGLKEFGL
jgi:hypothetical protein